MSAPTRDGYLAPVTGNRSETAGGRFDEADARRSARARGETLDQILDRNLQDLLQELRVAITGVQILFAFLLGLAFTQRFSDLDGFGLTPSTIALLCAAFATILLIAPVSFHRLVFRRRQKTALIAVADRLLMTGLALLVLAITSAVTLILDVTLGRWAAVIGGCATAVLALVTWYVLPLWARRSKVGLAPGPQGSEPDRAG
jgi:O-antigen/teichoic acid export membrane protein